MPFHQLFLLLLQLLVTVLALQTQTVWGQTASTGALLGQVTDPTGKGVPQASIEQRANMRQLVSRSTVSDDEGRFLLLLLPPGTHRVEVTKQGFSNTQSEPVQVAVTESIRVSIPIKLAGITQSVEVHGAAVPLQGDTLSLGRVVDVPMIQALPLAARNFTQIVDLSPGVLTGVNNAGELGLGGSGLAQIDPGNDGIFVHVHAPTTTPTNSMVSPSPICKPAASQAAELQFQIPMRFTSSRSKPDCTTSRLENTQGRVSVLSPNQVRTLFMEAFSHFSVTMS
jgi:hypothetical protein